MLLLVSPNHWFLLQPCKPVAKRQYYAFHAPEVFGEQDEFYHPVEADIW